MAVRYRIEIISISLAFVLLAGCSSSATPPAEPSAAAQKVDQTAAAPSATSAPAAETQKPVASPAPKAKAKAQTPVPAPVASPAPIADAPKTVAVVPPRPVDNAPAPPVSEPVPVPITPIAVPAPVPPPPTIRKVTIPEGTVIAVRTTDPIDSSTAKMGQIFRAALDAPLTVGDDTLAPRGADVDLRLTHVESAGSLKGQSKVSLELSRVVLAGKPYTVASNVYEKEATSQSSQTVKRTGIGAGIGAAVGAIIGGGKGAAIGAAAGGGTGVAIEAAGKGPQVHIDSESRLEFRLEQPLEVTLESAPSSGSGSNLSKDWTSGPRAVAPAVINNDTGAHDVSGKWIVSLDSPGTRNMELTLRQTGDKLEGTLDNRNRVQSLKGTVHGDSISFSTSSTSSDDSNFQVPVMRFDGRISNDKLSGTMTQSGGGNRTLSIGGRGGRGGNRGGRSGGGSGSSVTWSAERED